MAREGLSKPRAVSRSIVTVLIPSASAASSRVSASLGTPLDDFGIVVMSPRYCGRRQRNRDWPGEGKSGLAGNLANRIYDWDGGSIFFLRGLPGGR